MSGTCNAGMPCCQGLTCDPHQGCQVVPGGACYDDAGPCTGGTLCCPWAGGACVIVDGGCQAGGYNCVKPTQTGVCPNQDFP